MKYKKNILSKQTNKVLFRTKYSTNDNQQQYFFQKIALPVRWLFGDEKVQDILSNMKRKEINPCISIMSLFHKMHEH